MQSQCIVVDARCSCASDHVWLLNVSELAGDTEGHIFLQFILGCLDREKNRFFFSWMVHWILLKHARFIQPRRGTSIRMCARKIKKYSMCPSKVRNFVETCSIFVQYEREHIRISSQSCK